MALPDLQPTLLGERVLIRPVQPSDWDEMFRVASDPLIWELHPARDRYTEPAFRRFFDDALAAGSAFSFIERSTGAIVGSSRYNGYDSATHEVEIGWTFLARQFWGGSYNAEIKALMLSHAFTFADVVIFWVGEANYRSQRAMEKIGGVRRPGLHTRPVAGDVPHVIFEIRKPR